MNWAIGKRDQMGAPYRETDADAARRLAEAARPLFALVPSPTANGSPSRSSSDPSLIPVRAPDPVPAASVTLPLRLSAAVLEIRAKAKAALLGARQALERKRAGLRSDLARELGKLLTLRALTEKARRAYEAAVFGQSEFLARVPAHLRRFLSARTARVVRFVPWTLWGADTMIIARAWGLFGPTPLPFVAPSVGLTSLTSFLRAGLVSFGLIFGVRLAGGRLRQAVDELREQRPGVGLGSDVVVAGSVLLGAIGLAASTAELQAALLRIEGGGTSVNVPTSLLLAIVAFLISVSFACGYFLNEPELQEVGLHEQRVVERREALTRAIEAENDQKGVVRGLREQLRGLDREEQLLIAEQEAHTDREVYAHKKENGFVYGFEFAAERGSAEREGDA